MDEEKNKAETEAETDTLKTVPDTIEKPDASPTTTNNADSSTKNVEKKGNSQKLLLIIVLSVVGMFCLMLIICSVVIYKASLVADEKTKTGEKLVEDLSGGNGKDNADKDSTNGSENSSSSNNDTSNFKSYISIYYSIKYPGDWVMQDGDSVGSIIFNRYGEDNPLYTSSDNYNLIINKIPGAAGSSAFMGVNETFCSEYKKGMEETLNSSTSFDTMDITQSKIINIGEGKYPTCYNEIVSTMGPLKIMQGTYYVASKNYSFNIIYTYRAENKTAKDELEAVVSTLKLP